MLLYRSTHRAHTQGRHRLHPIATALTVVALRRTRPETLVDFGALLVGAASPATRSCGLLGSPVTRCCSQPDVGGSERITPAPVLLLCQGGVRFERLEDDAGEESF